MSDRTSAAICGAVLCILAGPKRYEPTDRDRELASKLMELAQSYDFNGCQMDADDEALKLGVARETKDKWGDIEIQFLWEDYKPPRVKKPKKDEAK